MTMARSVTEATQLTPAAGEQLLVYLGDRLQTGEVLVTAEQFVHALEEGYVALVGGEVDDNLRQQLVKFLHDANAEDPALLLAPGVENWIALSVLSQVRKAGWGITEVQEQGKQLIRTFMRTDKARALLTQLGLKSQLVNMSNCQRYVVNRIAGRQDDSHKDASRRLASYAAVAAERLATERAEAERAAADVDPSVGAEERLEALLEAPTDLPDAAETESRQQSEKLNRARLRQEQMGELIANLDNYIALGRITAEDAEGLKKSHKVDEAIRSGKIDKAQGGKIRNSILSGQARDRIDRNVKEALDFAVAYVQVFEALGRMEQRFDPGLRFLVRHGGAINEDAESGVSAALGPVIEALMVDLEAMRLLIDLMDRKEAEVRMIAAQLPPYNQIVRRDQGRVERVAVAEDFIGEIRTVSSAELTAQLHSSDRKQRARPAAAMLSLIVLINRLIKPTPFRKELRLLKINLIIEEFYHATDDVEQARQRATDFLRGRLRSLYPDISREETEELQRRGAAIVQRVEDKVLADRAARKLAQAADAAGSSGDEDGSLTEEDQKRGVQIQRVSVRIAGNVREIRYRILPDADDPERFVIGKRDPESGEMVPVLRRGSPRYVERSRDGTWTMARE
jgi:hypothetical protein